MKSYFETYVREVPDFPKPGIGFKDITPIFADPEALKKVCEHFKKAYEGIHFDVIVGPESRGFIFGVALSMYMSKGFVPVRKAGKLPGPSHRVSYSLEYGQDSLEIHQNAIKPHQKVLIIDDLLATGGTIKACEQLVRRCGGDVVGCAFFIELAFLEGRKNLPGLKVESILQYLQE
jgi:adenine phosphoribosyltransferase